MAVRCSQVEARLVDAVDRRLSTVEELELLAHLEGCGECARRATAWGRLVPALRAIEPAPPSAARTRRMEQAVEQALAAAPPAAAPSVQKRSALWVGGGVAVAAAAVFAIALVWRRPPVVPATGPATVERALPPSLPPPVPLPVPLPVPPPMIVAAGERRALTVGPAQLSVEGPATLSYTGAPDRARVSLRGGTLQARVDRLAAGQSFTVATADGSVTVHGTRFAVAHRSDGGAWVRVYEGRVLVERADGSRSELETGATALDHAGAAVGEGPPDPTQLAALEPTPPAPSRTRPAPAPRRGEPARNADPSYLRAETLRRQGRLAEAVAAYRELAASAPSSSTRENALHAAAELEQRSGHAAAAHRLYQQALAVAPDGALAEEARLGLCEAARALGDVTVERADLHSYLAHHPAGRFHDRAAARLAALTQSGARP